MSDDANSPKNLSDSIKEQLSAVVDGEASDLELRRVLKEMDADLAHQWSRYHLVKQTIHGGLANEARDSGIEDVLSLDISAAVATAIADEEAPGEPDATNAASVDSMEEGGRSPKKDSSYGWRRQLSSVAVAASVSLAVIWGWQNYGITEIPGAAPTVASVSQGLAPAATLAANTGSSLGVQRAPSVAPTVVGLRQQVMPAAASAAPHQAQSAPAADPNLIRFNQSDINRINRYFMTHSNHAAFSAGHGMMPYARVVNPEHMDH